MSEIEYCPLCESPLVASDLERAFGQSARCSSKDCLRGEYTPEQQADYRRFCASPTGTARMLVEAKAEIERLRRNYYNIADAIARESESPEQLAGIARNTRMQLSAAESQIAALKVDLAAMQRERDAAIDRNCHYIDEHDKALRLLLQEREEHGLELSQARAELEQAQAIAQASEELQEKHNKRANDWQKALNAEIAAHAATRAAYLREAADLIAGRAADYPTYIFPEPTGAPGEPIDRHSASMARHCAKVWSVWLRERARDTESTAAGEAYEELEAVYQAAKRFDRCDADYAELEAAVAKVDARRAGGKDGAGCPTCHYADCVCPWRGGATEENAQHSGGRVRAKACVIVGCTSPAKLLCRICGPLCYTHSEEWQCSNCGACCGEMNAAEAHARRVGK